METLLSERGRLLIISNFYPPQVIGGAEVVAHRHALLMKERGWDVAVLAGAPPSAAVPTGAVRFDVVEGIEVCRLGHRSLEPGENFRWPLANRVLRSLIATFRPDWVHAHNIAGLGADLIRTAKRAGIRTAVTLHDNWGYCFKNTRLRNDGSLCLDPQECHLCLPIIREGGKRIPIRLRRDFVRSRLDEADLLISPSFDLARRYSEGGFDTPGIIVQSNGIDLGRIPPRKRKPQEKLKFLFAGYLGEHKGVPVLLNAISQLVAKPDLTGRWSLTIAGHGHLGFLVQQTIADRQWDNCVEFVGQLPREGLLAHLSESDVVILPSSWPENEPVILLEAIASGAALIASRLGGNLDIIKS